MKRRSSINFPSLVSATAPKTIAIALALLFAISASATGADQAGDDGSRPVRQVKPGQVSRAVSLRRNKVDDEVSRRQNANPLLSSRVIVTLAPGAQLAGRVQAIPRGEAA